MNWLADKIEQWPTAKLLPYARNARTHSEDQVAQIAASIAGVRIHQSDPGGQRRHHRRRHGRAGRRAEAGSGTVPVVVLDHLTPTQRRALVIADNRIAENAGWDDAMLRIELEALQLEGVRSDITGFDADALAELIAGDEPDNGETDEDAVPEVSETPSRVRAMSGSGPAPTAVRRLDRGRELRPVRWRTGGHGLHRPAVQRELRQQRQGQDARQGSRDPERQPGRRLLRLPAGSGVTPTVAHCRGGIYVAMSSSELDVLQAAFRAAGGKMVDVHHLGQEHLHPGPRRLPAPVRADPLRMARGGTAPLVW